MYRFVIGYETAVLRYAWAASRDWSVLMDAQTVIAICELLLVMIGIIGLVMIRRE